ncbi:MAG: DUF1559 domain-containing protein [Planctomycetota bacterium]
MELPKRNRRVGRVRPAFTLVELLVVIAIIGMLLALLIPAIVTVQESARQVQCQNNQRQLCLALLAYEGSQKSFPGWQNTPSKSISGCNSISWVTMLLPRLDRNDLWKKVNSPGFDFAYTLVPLGLKLPICPSDPPPSNQSSGESSYIANGLVLRDPTLNPPLPPLTVDYISGADGAANTLLLGENTQKAPSAAVGASNKAHDWYYSTVGSVITSASCAAAWPTQINHTFGFNISASNYTSAFGATRANAYATFAAPYGSQTSYYNGNPMTANINSNHSGGSVVSFCDGHIQFLRDDVGVNFATGSDPAAKITVYQLLVTPDGSQFGGEPAADESQFSK